MNEEAFYIATDTMIIVSNLRNVVTDVVITDATITGKLYTIGGSEVSGGGVTFSPTGVDGEYSGSLSDAVSLTPGDEYYLELLIVKDASKLTLRMIRAARHYIE